MAKMFAKNAKRYIAIDLGGTFIKGGIIDDRGNILIQDKIPTESQQGADRVLTNIIHLSQMLLANRYIKMHQDFP